MASKILIKTVFLIGLLLLNFSTAAFAKKRFALVIGNSDYEEQALKNPTNDARDIAKALQELGFSVDLLLNASQQDMEQAISRFGGQLGRNTIGLFYFSGHGVQYDGSNYLIPIGAMSQVTAPEHLRYKTVDAGYVLGTMKQAANSLNIVILDACRNNPFRSFSRSADRGLKRMAGAEGTLIAYATSPGNVALDGNGRNSPYTEQLVKFMRQPGLPVELMFKQVRREVKTSTEGKQSPWYEASIDGDFYFLEQAKASTGDLVRAETIETAASPEPQATSETPTPAEAAPVLAMNTPNPPQIEKAQHWRFSLDEMKATSAAAGLTDSFPKFEDAGSNASMAQAAGGDPRAEEFPDFDFASADNSGMKLLPHILGRSSTLFYETFLDNRNQWAVWENGDYYNAYFEDGRYLLETKNDNNSSEILTMTGSRPKNFDIEVTSAWLQGVDNYRYGLVLGTDEDHYYTFGASANGQTVIGLNKEDEEKIPADPLDWQEDTAKVGDAGKVLNHHKVEVRDNLMTYYLNDQRIGTVLNEFSSDKWVIGVMVQGQQRVAFDELVVTGFEEMLLTGH